MSGIEERIELLYSKNDTEAYEALKELQKVSSESDRVYIHIDKFIAMLDSDSSSLRNRGLTLIVANARRDHDKKSIKSSRLSAAHH